MKIKRTAALLLSVSMMMGLATTANATNNQVGESEHLDSKPVYAITDEVVIIDSVEYEIHNNSIEYEGRTYVIEEGDTLVSYDEHGQQTILCLPLESNKVTDPEEIARLNASVAALERIKEWERAIPSTSRPLPYTANVPEGQYLTRSPAFDVVYSARYQPVIVLELKNFPLFADRRFHVTFYVCDMFGDWASKTISEQDFLFDDDCRFEVASSARYGVMNITNLYGNPSPSYTYTISRSNLLPMNEGGDLT